MIEDLGECYELEDAGTVRSGYPRLDVAGRSHGRGKARYISVHRLAWMAVNGPIPVDGQILHKCDNPPCFRASHLYLGNHTDNVRDRVMRLRSARKLTDQEVAEIRHLYSRYGQRLGELGVSGKELSERYGVGRSQISRIVNGLSRKDPGTR